MTTLPLKFDHNKMLTKLEMSEHLLAMGLKRKYKPTWDGDHDHGTILLDTRKLAFADGVMKGSEIGVYDNATVRVWTSRKNKAMAVAKAQGFKIRLLDGEAELYIPAAKADEYLHTFGARVKKVVSYTPEQRAAMAARLASVRLGIKKAVAPVL